MQRVSDKITYKDIGSWNNDIITITSGTGTGKSHFIKTTLYEYAKKNNKKILMLLHRTNCKDQFLDEITKEKKTDVIDIMLYQKLEALYTTYKVEFDFSSYQYVVCDEFHYFLGDSVYNVKTDISLNLILQQTNTTRIFLSATSDYINKYLRDIKKIKPIKYPNPIKYNFIENLIFYMQDKTVESMMDEAIEKNCKCIFFIQSAEKAYNLFKKFRKYSLFNCSKSNSQYYKFVDKDKISGMLKNEQFEELFLITTLSLDAGVNIMDEQVKNIFIDAEDTISIIQCIGRRRILNDHDKISVYIKTITNQQLTGKIKRLKDKIAMAEYFKTHTVKEYISEYYKKYDKSNMVYDDIVYEPDKGTKKLNELMYYKCKYDIEVINQMIKLGKFGFNKYISKKFGFMQNGYYNYTILEEDSKKDNLENYLNNVVGKKLFSEERKELINEIGLKDARNRMQKDIKQFNAYFISNNLKFYIENNIENSRSSEFYKKTYWMVYLLSTCSEYAI